MAVWENHELHFWNKECVGEGEKEEEWSRRGKQNEITVGAGSLIKEYGYFPSGRVEGGLWWMPTGLTCLILYHPLLKTLPDISWCMWLR